MFIGLNNNQIINADIQGWPIYKVNLYQLLLELGATLDKDGNVVFNKHLAQLNYDIKTLEDDGMGYGINEQYITNDISINHKDNCIHLFRDKYNSEEVNKLLHNDN